MQCVRYSHLQSHRKGSDARWACLVLKHDNFFFTHRRHHKIVYAQSPRLGLLRRIPVNMEWHKLCPLHNDDMHHLLHVHILCSLPPPLSWEILLSVLSPQQSPHHMCPTCHVKLFINSKPGHLCQMVCNLCPRKHHTPRVGMCATSTV